MNPLGFFINKSTSEQKSNNSEGFFSSFTAKAQSFISSLTLDDKKKIEKEVSFTDPLESLIKQCEQLREKSPTQANKVIGDFCLKFLKTNHPIHCSNEKTVQYFTEKVGSVILNSDFAIKSKHEILKNVLDDFNHMILETTTRVAQDIHNGELKNLNVGPEHQLTQIICLGEETHNCGRIPLLLTFSGGQKVIYKPRSMRPEYELCNPHHSVFNVAGLGTYEIVCRRDENGEYGYCDQLKNVESENKIESIDELVQYLSQLSFVDRLCNQLGITDLHCYNIITDKKIAYVTDAEAFLMPPEIPTGVFQELGAGNTFDPYGGMVQDKQAKNKIYFSDVIKGRGDSNFLKYQMTEKDLSRLGIDLKNIPIPETSEELHGCIKEARNALQDCKSRFIIEDTELLKLPLVSCDPHDHNFDSFANAIRDLLGEKGFVFDENSYENITKGVREDVLHNDVPVFYFDPRQQSLLYHDVVIGMKKG